MSRTLFIDTTKLPRAKAPGGGEMTEILNDTLAGAKNVVGTLRWLNAGEKYEAGATGRHQLLYLMEGAGRITLANKTADVKKGMGVYLGPAESATIEAASGASVKLFQLVVPQLPK